jgi:hypothetical protein
LAGGFVGTAIMTMMMYHMAPMMIGQPMDIAQMLSPFAGGNWMGGMILHFINGTVIFPWIYGALLYPVLPGGPTAKGICWGLILWFLAQVFVMQAMGGGFFSVNMGGMMAVIASLLGHLIYGATLGAIANGPQLETDARTSPIAHRP